MCSLNKFHHAIIIRIVDRTSGRMKLYGLLWRPSCGRPVSERKTVVLASLRTRRVQLLSFQALCSVCSVFLFVVQIVQHDTCTRALVHTDYNIYNQLFQYPCANRVTYHYQSRVQNGNLQYCEVYALRADANSILPFFVTL